MPKKKIPFAIAYDFDGTLAPGNMQERDFIPAIGTNKKKFWAEVMEESEKHSADNILMYMKMMLRKAATASVRVHKEDFESYGAKLSFFQGIDAYKEGRRAIKGWFDRIDFYGNQSGVEVSHFVVSSGIREMVAGTSIAKHFKAIYASSFCYDHNGVAEWPALALNYTTKTQYLFRINKGSLRVHDHSDINRFVPEEQRPVPFSHMVYIGDGETDIPCFRVVKDRGGHSIAVFPPKTKGARTKSMQMVKDGRVNFLAPADYREGGEIDQAVKALIDKVAHDIHVRRLHARN